MWYEDVESLEMDYPDEHDEHMYIVPDLPYEPPWSTLSDDLPHLETVIDPLSTKLHFTPKKKPCRHNETCVICLEPVDYTCSTPLLLFCQQQCGQVFHATCLNKWKKTSCPICRCPVKPCGKVLCLNKT